VVDSKKKENVQQSDSNEETKSNILDKRTIFSFTAVATLACAVGYFFGGKRSQ